MRPAISPAAERLVGLLGDAILAPDDQHDWAYTRLIDAASVNRERFERIFRARDGRVGLAALLDPDTCPPEELPALAMWAGATLRPGSSVVEQRETIRRRPALRRGSPGAIARAVATTLTGSRRVDVLVTGPWTITVRTYTSQTPDPAATQAAALRAAPAWVLPTMETLAGQTWDQLMAKHDSWADVTAAYTSWADLLEDV